MRTPAAVQSLERVMGRELRLFNISLILASLVFTLSESDLINILPASLSNFFLFNS